MTAPTKRYTQMFANLAEKNEGAFISFVAIGDPNPDESLEIIKALVDAGADALELGIPFSDPSADGVTIQLAAERALESGVNTNTCIDIIKQIREYAPETPIGLLLYGNLVFARGVETFYQDMADAGVDSVLIADVPIRESKRFREAAHAAGIDPIFIAPPNASDSTLKDVAEHGQGYTYVLGRAGVTGTETVVQMPSDALIKSLKEFNAAPPVLGFGISTPEHVKNAIASGAKGAISGSAVVKIIEKNIGNQANMLEALKTFVSDMKAATKV